MAPQAWARWNTGIPASRRRTFPGCCRGRRRCGSRSRPLHRLGQVADGSQKSPTSEMLHRGRTLPCKSEPVTFTPPARGGPPPAEPWIRAHPYQVEPQARLDVCLNLFHSDSSPYWVSMCFPNFARVQPAGPAGRCTGALAVVCHHPATVCSSPTIISKIPSPGNAV